VVEEDVAEEVVDMEEDEAVEDTEEVDMVEEEGVEDMEVTVAVEEVEEVVASSAARMGTSLTSVPREAVEEDPGAAAVMEEEVVDMEEEAVDMEAEVVDTEEEDEVGAVEDMGEAMEAAAVDAIKPNKITTFQPIIFASTGIFFRGSTLAL